jgi:hypothetical protein
MVYDSLSAYTNLIRGREGRMNQQNPKNLTANMKKETLLLIVAILAITVGVVVIAYGIYGVANPNNKDVIVVTTVEFEATEDGELFVYVNGNEAYHDDEITAGTTYNPTCTHIQKVPKNDQTVTVKAVLKDNAGVELKTATEKVNISDGDIFFVTLKLQD